MSHNTCQRCHAIFQYRTTQYTRLTFRIYCFKVLSIFVCFLLFITNMSCYVSSLTCCLTYQSYVHVIILPLHTKDVVSLWYTSGSWGCLPVMALKYFLRYLSARWQSTDDSWHNLMTYEVGLWWLSDILSASWHLTYLTECDDIWGHPVGVVR